MPFSAKTSGATVHKNKRHTRTHGHTRAWSYIVSDRIDGMR